MESKIPSVRFQTSVPEPSRDETASEYESVLRTKPYLLREPERARYGLNCKYAEGSSISRLTTSTSNPLSRFQWRIELVVAAKTYFPTPNGRRLNCKVAPICSSIEITASETILLPSRIFEPVSVEIIKYLLTWAKLLAIIVLTIVKGGN